MKKIQSQLLINELEAATRKCITEATYLKSTDPALLLDQPAPGKWSVIQVIEHLNSYDRYYLLAIERSMQKDRPAKEFFKPGWLGSYFTKMMKPTDDGRVVNKMQAPSGHRPPAHLDAFPVISSFIEQQHYLLELLEKARAKDLGSIRVPISLAKFIRLKLGDTFGFLVAHKQRHFIQIRNTIAAVKTYAVTKFEYGNVEI